MKIKHKISPYISFIFLSYCLQLLVFTFFRILLYTMNAGKLDKVFKPFLLKAFIVGYKFDTLVCSYLLALPFLILSVLHLSRSKANWLKWVIIGFISLTGIISILAASADIPYYNFFNARLTASVHMWIASPATMLAFIFTEPHYYPFIATFILLSALYLFATIKLGKYILIKPQPSYNKTFYDITLFTLAAAVLFIGMRGGNFKRTLKLKESFFSNSAFINQLGINPVYSYAYSLTLYKLSFMNDDIAISNVKSYLNSNSNQKDYPISRSASQPDTARRMNVVLVIMESMSANMMGMFGNEQKPTPTLDSLAAHGLSFTNFYTAGIHTCNGVYSTLYGMPALMREHPMSNINANNLKMSGLPVTLKKDGYQTAFFCTHDEEFDNIGYFLPRNGIDSLYSKRFYPESANVNVWGVSDEYLFKYALGKLDIMAGNKKPFFSSILTISTHEPPQLPKNTTFKSKFSEPLYQVYEYADHCIAEFMKQCSTRPWFNNTVFVFVADHGLAIDKTYEMSLSFNHSPCIIYSPKIMPQGISINNPALQIDVFPTLMGLLNQQYTNNTLGIDLLKEKRPFAYFSADDKLGCIDDKYFFMIDRSESEYLFDYTKKSAENVIGQHTAKADSMKKYAQSMLQTTQWMIHNNKAGSIK